MPTTSIPSSSDEWVLINDEGFVYKRRKTAAAAASIRALRPDPRPDPEAEERERRERKKRALVKVKEKYRREISLWDNLSNTLRASEQRVNEDEDEDEMGKETRVDEVDVGREYGELIDGILIKIEAQEAIIANLTALCDAAEVLCVAHEQKVAQSFLELPIWRSPRQLMSSLCED